MTGLRILLGAAILGGLGAAAPFTPLWLISLVTLAIVGWGMKPTYDIPIRR